jgi:anti-anti-sigma factor
MNAMAMEQSAIVRFVDDLDYTRREEYAAALARLDAAQVAIVDLSGVYYVDSCFLSEMTRLYKRKSDRGTPFAIRIVGARTQLRRIFDLMSLDSLVQFYDSVEEAHVAPL